MRVPSILVAIFVVALGCSSSVGGDGDGDDDGNGDGSGDDTFVLDLTPTTLTLSPACAATPMAVPPAFTYSNPAVYINPDYTGEDSDGSFDHPWKDLTFLSGGELQPQTEYLFKRGTTLDITQTYMQIGYAANPTTNVKLGAYGTGDRPHLFSQRKGDSDAIIGMGPNISHIWIEGLEISYEGTWRWGHTIINAQTTGYSNNVVILDNEFYNGNSGIRLWGVGSPFDDSDWFILGNHFHDINEDAIITARADRIEVGHNVFERVNTAFIKYEGPEAFCPEASCPGDAIQLINGDNHWVHHNIIDRDQIGNKFDIILTGTATEPPYPTGAVIECNTLAGPALTGGGQVSMYLAGHNDMTVRYNTILPPHTTGIWSSNLQAKIYGNIFVGGLGGVRALRLSAAVTDNHIFNNVFYGIEARDTDAFVYGYGTATNNIFYNLPEDNVVERDIIGSHNLFLTDEDTFGEDNVIGDPLFVDAENKDFHLQSGSPAINAGTTLADWTVDFDGEAVSSPPEIGVFEFQP